MPEILCLETAGQVCSVALAADNGRVWSMAGEGKNDHSALLTGMIGSVLVEAGLSLAGLDAVAVSMGPGSYTGLRIGVSTAKGLCYSLDKPLLGVSTLQAMAAGMAERMVKTPGVDPERILFCPMIDARRMEVYTGLYDYENKLVREVSAEIIDENSFRDYLEKDQIVFFGDGALKTMDLLKARRNAIFIEDFSMNASYMASISVALFREGKFENTAYFEPFYLKDFIAGAPKVKGLR
jgi:tRNA threonylcarbamoyladenosine biosynthesis protein TsaB